ncbi:hypothetical protein KI387_038417, partial [Taxus chinensis]
METSRSVPPIKSYVGQPIPPHPLQLKLRFPEKVSQSSDPTVVSDFADDIFDPVLNKKSKSLRE